MYEIQNEDVYESFGKDKEIMILAIIHLSRNIMMIQTNYLLIRWKMEQLLLKKIVGFKPKMYSSLVDDISEHKKAKVVNKYFVERISYHKYKNVLMNRKCLRYSVIWSQSKNHRIETYETR